MKKLITVLMVGGILSLLGSPEIHALLLPGLENKHSSTIHLVKRDARARIGQPNKVLGDFNGQPSNLPGGVSFTYQGNATNDTLPLASIEPADMISRPQGYFNETENHLFKQINPFRRYIVIFGFVVFLGSLIVASVSFYILVVRERGGLFRTKKPIDHHKTEDIIERQKLHGEDHERASIRRNEPTNAKYGNFPEALHAKGPQNELNPIASHKRKIYSNEYKERVLLEVALFHSKGMTKSKILRDLGISRTTYYRWLKAA